MADNQQQKEGRKTQQNKENGEVKKSQNSGEHLTRMKNVSAVEKMNLLSTAIIVCAAVKEEVPVHDNALSTLKVI